MLGSESGSGVNLIIYVRYLYSVYIYVRFCVKRFELSHAMNTAL